MSLTLYTITPTKILLFVTYARVDVIIYNTCCLLGQTYETHKYYCNLRTKCTKRFNIYTGAKHSYHCALRDLTFLVVEFEARCAASGLLQTTQGSLNSRMPQAKRSVQYVRACVQTISFKTFTGFCLRLPEFKVLLARNETSEE